VTVGRRSDPDTVCLPEALLEISRNVRSREARKELWELSTLVEELGTCPFCGRLLTEGTDASCPNPRCRHLRETGSPFVRTLG